jgi:hypothetical protein
MQATPRLKRRLDLHSEFYLFDVVADAIGLRCAIVTHHNLDIMPRRPHCGPRLPSNLGRKAGDRRAVARMKCGHAQKSQLQNQERHSRRNGKVNVAIWPPGA